VAYGEARMASESRQVLRRENLRNLAKAHKTAIKVSNESRSIELTKAIKIVGHEQLESTLGGVTVT